MSDHLVQRFRAQLDTAMKSVMSKAVCDIMLIFESSLRDHQMELVHKGEEVAHLKIKLQTAEIKLKELVVGGDRGVEIQEAHTNRREADEREPEAVVHHYGQTTGVPNIDIEMPDDWCAPLGDETTTEDVCPSIRLRQLLIPLSRIPVIKQREVKHGNESPKQKPGVRRSLRGSSIMESEKHTKTILPVYTQETQPKSRQGHKRKLPQSHKQENCEKPATVVRQRGRRKLEEKEQARTVRRSSRREEGKNTTETEENVEKIYTCKICNKEFSTDFGHRVHARSHMNCRGCRKVFSTPCELKSHKRNCNKLKKRLAQESRDYENRLFAAKIQEYDNIYSCPYCTKTSFSRSKLADHIRRHTIEKPFACSECPKMFHVNSFLKKHMKMHKDKKKAAETNLHFAWTVPVEGMEEGPVTPSKMPSS